MLKSYVRPLEVLAGNCHLTVTRSVAFRDAVAPTQLRRQLRHKSSNTTGQSSRWGNKRSIPSATEPAAPSKTKSSSPKTSTKSQRDSQNFKSNPEAQSGAEIEIGFRPLLINAVKPTPNQDLTLTRPADLETVLPAEPDESGNVPFTAHASYFYRLGKSYVNFYKTGVKNIWNNRKEYKKIKARLGPHTPEDAALYGGQDVWRQIARRTDNSTEVEIKKIPTITRREYQLCLRTRHDLGKLIPFGIVFAICGEFTPLVILALGSSVVPYTCRIPKQVQHDRRWFEKRLEAQAAEGVVKAGGSEVVGSLMEPEFLNALAFLHGVSPFATLPPIIGKLFFRFWVRPRLRRRGWEILADTVLIRREGGFGLLEPVEVYEYANKFFCPELVIASRADLYHTGTISWDPEFASVLVEALEERATIMLARDWAHDPENSRYHQGLIFESGTLARYMAKEKEFQETGKP